VRAVQLQPGGEKISGRTNGDWSGLRQNLAIERSRTVKCTADIAVTYPSLDKDSRLDAALQSLPHLFDPA
jgi:hypothetical protein